MNKAGLLLPVGILTFLYWKKSKDMNLRYFSAVEFGTWWLNMDKFLLELLDELRHRSGYYIMISPAFGSLGRFTGNSFHNVTLHGEVMAADIMPYKLVNGEKVELSLIELTDFFMLAKNMGFGGVGIYPEWKPFKGLHVDSRTIENNHVATWGAIKQDGKQIYLSATDTINQYIG